MASSTIVAPRRPRANPADRAAVLDGYARFRSIIDGYVEDPRPSIEDVRSVAGILQNALTPATGHESLTPRTGQNVPGLIPDLGGQVRFSEGSSRVQFGRVRLGAETCEGMVWRLRVSPGVIGIRKFDVLGAERTAERRAEQQRRHADLMGSMQQPGTAFGELVFEGESDQFEPLPEKKPGAGEISKWSERSRMRLSEMVASLDFSDWIQADGALCMVTLTVPGDWLTVAPDGKTFKKLLKRFEARWRRTMGSWRCLWKLEFQKRGAPHWHGLMRVPALVGGVTFEEWLSQTWADCVQHPDAEEYAKHLRAGTRVDFSGKDFSDPRRIALYFLGHSSKTTDGKEYQHIVPAEWQEPGKGPGRFWGHPGLSKAVVEIDVTREDAFALARVLRKVKRARAWKTQVLREQGTAKREGTKVPGVFEVLSKTPKPKGRRGRSAHRTWNRQQRELAEAAGQPYVWQKRFGPTSLGVGGKVAGGWVLVNDALQLGLDIVRVVEAATSEPLPVRNIAVTMEELTPASRRPYSAPTNHLPTTQRTCFKCQS